MRKYKTTGNTTLFDKEDTERKLTEMRSPTRRFMRVDFPTFGLPTILTKPDLNIITMKNEEQILHSSFFILSFFHSSRVMSPSLKNCAGSLAASFAPS